VKVSNNYCIRQQQTQAKVPTVVYHKVFDGNHVLTGKEEMYP